MALIKIDRTARDAALARTIPTLRSSPTGWWRADCPFCIYSGKDDTGGKSFAYLITVGIYICWKCGTRGKLDGLIIASVPEIPKPTQKVEDLPEELREVFLGPEGFTLLTKEVRADRAFREAVRMLYERGVGDELIEEFQIGACISGKRRGRVIVPILAEDNETWLGWVGRAYYPNPKLKYVYPRGMQRYGLLFNPNAVHEKTDAPLIVVEGVFDALYCYPDGVAVLGSHSESQIAVLAEATRPIVVALDGDAWRKGEALAMRLKLEGKNAENLELPPKLDPDDVDRDWLMQTAWSLVHPEQ